MVRRLLVCLLLARVLPVGSAVAQTVPTPASPQEASPASSGQDLDPAQPGHPETGAAQSDPASVQGDTMDVGDLWHLIRHGRSAATDATARVDRRYFVIAPAIGSKPSTGFSGGFSSNVAFFAGPPATTHISVIGGGMRLSQKQQTMFGSRVAVFTAGDRWFISGDNRISWTSQNTYPLGDAPPTSGTNLKFDVLKLYEAVYGHVAPGLFVGAGVNFSSHYNVRPGKTTSLASWTQSAYVAYSNQYHFSPTRQDSNGVSVSVRYDTRDNSINADKGTLASATYRTFFKGFLDGDSTWQELSIDARAYKALNADANHKLAFWFLGDLVTGGTAPFWDLPSTSTDGRSARGYGEGRFRGQRLLYWETEYRMSLIKNGLVGFVAFANLTTVDSVETHERLFSSFAPGAGFGSRFLLNKRSRTNLCTDWGWGKQGSRGFYLSIQEAF